MKGVNILRKLQSYYVKFQGPISENEINHQEIFMQAQRCIKDHRIR